jgi:hypothetical protein
MYKYPIADYKQEVMSPLNLSQDDNGKRKISRKYHFTVKADIILHKNYPGASMNAPP